jgi:anti-sigma factor RsiW
MDDICVRYRSDLSAFADGQLEAHVQAEVQSHVGNCELCSEELETLRALSQFLIDGFNPENLPMPDLWTRIEDSLPSACELVVVDLSAYLDNELPPAAQEGVNKHIKECLPCMSAFKDLNEATKTIAKGLELPASIKIDLWPAVKARLNEDCALIQSELSSYADQEVPTLRHRSVTKHLLDCQQCRENFDKISAVGEVIRDAYKPVIPDNFDLWPDVKRQLQVVPFTPKSGEQKQQSGGRFGGTRLYWATSAAAAVAIVGSLALWMGAPQLHAVEPVTSEAYLIESAMTQPAEIAEAVVYDQQ